MQRGGNARKALAPILDIIREYAVNAPHDTPPSLSLPGSFGALCWVLRRLRARGAFLGSTPGRDGRWKRGYAERGLINGSFSLFA
jgi:hypothetical protein